MIRKMVSLIHFFVGCILVINISEGTHVVKIEKAEVEIADKDYITITANVRQEGAKSVIDIDANLLQEIPEDIYMQLHIEKKVNGAYQTMYKSEVINKCHFVENRDKYPVEKAITDDFSKYGNLMQNCPVKKGNYYLKGFVFEPRGVIAEKITAGEYCVHFIIMKEIKTEMKTLFSIKWFIIVTE